MPPNVVMEDLPQLTGIVGVDVAGGGMLSASNGALMASATLVVESTLFPFVDVVEVWQAAKASSANRKMSNLVFIIEEI